MPYRPVTSIGGGGGGLLFDPTKVKLKAAPQIPRSNTDNAATDLNPFGKIKNNLRPTTQIGSAPVLPITPVKPQPKTPPIPNRNKPSTDVPPSFNTPPPKPMAGTGRGLPKLELNFNFPKPGASEFSHSAGDIENHTKQIKEEKEELSLPDFALSPRSGNKIPIDRSKKRRTRMNLTSFLLRRPQKDSLEDNGILQKNAEAAYPELGTKFHEQNALPTDKERPVMQNGRNCITPGCGKKLKGRRVCIF